MDMRYHWLTDRFRKIQFDVYWRPGRENLGNYHTKHHSAELLIPQVRPAHKYPNSPWEMIHPPGGVNAVCM
jgi:hypothetical protein